VRVPGGAAAHHLAFMPKAGLLAVALSNHQPLKTDWPAEEAGGDPHATAAYTAAAAAAAAARTETRYEVCWLALLHHSPAVLEQNIAKYQHCS
jgi:hypothetical protein